MKPETIRPTKKQSELLEYIGVFIAEHGYSPSYREIMKGLNYSSVATVALHINSLIARGHLRKRSRSARSLEVSDGSSNAPPTEPNDEAQAKWLIAKIEDAFKAAEQTTPTTEQISSLKVLVSSLRVLKLEAAASSFSGRLSILTAGNK